jgi:RNA polymerase sigma-70 factor (ECF subfamily)
VNATGLAADALSGLLERAARGDRDAFASLYRETSAKLFAVSLRIVRERQLAEEVLQDSFVAIWHHAADYSRARSAPVTWMAAIVRNRSLDLLRRHSREVEDVDEILAGALVDETAAPATDLERRRGEHAVHECLGELEADQRQSIALAFFHGLSHSELAGHLRRPLGTVKTHIRRGLARLRDCLERAGATPR